MLITFDFFMFFVQIRQILDFIYFVNRFIFRAFDNKSTEMRNINNLTGLNDNLWRI